ncbi:uncharacterized protein DNG_01110 [Cephalotrichum gorgonifer]|uniref:Uncharacterized protein n=1 Tax=Cephalotrichum gorgonifer TaxID=2041049 RepID=A0AAE8MQT8_9PEZI|nr:uncharacterized protein DNG_01110 [Cephalotrichum gorgonifer]
MATVVIDTPQAGTETQRSSINYRNSLPGAPKPVCRQSLDESSLADLYHHHSSNDSSPIMQPKHVSGEACPPALPTRSSLRASRLLDGMSLKLDDAAESATLREAAAPHELYLSSEEDASSSASDFSDASDSGTDEPAAESEKHSPVAGGARRKRSHEDIARAVPFVFAGKPTVVTITTVRRRSASQATAPSTSTTKAHMMARRQSTFVAPPQPPRSATIAELVVGSGREKHYSQPPSFLDTDPFASSSPMEEEASSPRTSGGTSMLKKTFGIVRKRSRPFLNNLQNSSQTFLSHANPSSASLASSASEADSNAAPRAPARARTSTLPSINTSQGPVTYQDILRNAKRNATTPQSPGPASPASPALPAAKKSRILSGLSMSRRSIRSPI